MKNLAIALVCCLASASIVYSNKSNNNQAKLGPTGDKYVDVILCTDAAGNVISYGSSCSSGDRRCTPNPCGPASAPPPGN